MTNLVADPVHEFDDVATVVGDFDVGEQRLMVPNDGVVREDS